MHLENSTIMAKINLSKQDIEKILEDNPDLIGNTPTPWWVVVLKVMAYAIGLLLAGYTTPSVISSVQTGVVSLSNIL